jgi:hypothetical protein
VSPLRLFKVNGLIFSELFAGLLGRRIRIEGNEGEDHMDDDVVDLNDGLRIFG